MQSAHSNHSNVGHIYQRFITVELNRRFRKRKAFYVRSRVEEFWEPNGSSEHHKENQAEREGNANSNGVSCSFNSNFSLILSIHNTLIS